MGFYMDTMNKLFVSGKQIKGAFSDYKGLQGKDHMSAVGKDQYDSMIEFKQFLDALQSQGLSEKYVAENQDLLKQRFEESK